MHEIDSPEGGIGMFGKLAESLNSVAMKNELEEELNNTLMRVVVERLRQREIKMKSYLSLARIVLHEFQDTLVRADHPGASTWVINSPRSNPQSGGPYPQKIGLYPTGLPITDANACMQVVITDSVFYCTRSGFNGTSWEFPLDRLSQQTLCDEITRIWLYTPQQNR